MNTPNPAELSDEIKKALFAGKKIEAIKLYRDQTGVGLTDAKAVVEAMEARLRGVAAAQISGLPNQTEAIREALFAGRKIMAIKLYREQFKVGLAEAKTAVETIEAQLRSTSPALFGQAQRRGCFSVIAVLAVLGFAVWKALS